MAASLQGPKEGEAKFKAGGDKSGLETGHGDEVGRPQNRHGADGVVGRQIGKEDPIRVDQAAGG